MCDFVAQSQCQFLFHFRFLLLYLFMYAYGIDELRLSAAPPCKGAFPGGRVCSSALFYVVEDCLNAVFLYQHFKGGES